MNMMQREGCPSSCVVLLLCWWSTITAEAFEFTSSVQCRTKEGLLCKQLYRRGGGWWTSSSSSSSCSSQTMNMGLYDDPLPPRPPPLNKKNDENNNEDDEEDEDDLIDISLSSERNLFSFNSLGKEENDLLPNLARRLDKGVDCYYESTDRLVVNLVEKTSCSVDDARWALEACNGWTRISTARRMILNRSRQGYEDNIDLMELETEEDFQERKQNRLAEEKERKRQEDIDYFFKGGIKDEAWLPGKQNPRPIDDEPWFTG